jgi:YVTN family beta-propeller protein
MGVSRPAVDVNSTTSRVYVTVPDGNSVSVMDGTTNTVVATVPVGESPTGVAVNPTTNLIYVTDAAWSAWSGTVSVIDGTTNTVVSTIPVNQWPLDVAVNPVTNLIYVANAAWSGTISVIDGGSNTVVGNIPVGFSPQRVAVNPNTNSVYVAMARGDLLVIDGTTNTVVATLPATDASDVAVNPATNHVFVAQDENVTVIDGATNSVVTSIPLAWQYCQTPGAVAVAVNPITGVVYVGANQYWFFCSEMYVINDSPGAGLPPAASPMSCAPAPAPPLAEGMEWVALLCGACNPVATTYPDSTPVATVAGAVAPPEALEALWRFDGAEWTGYSAASPAASDLTEVDRLDVVFICVEGAATFTRPVP